MDAIGREFHAEAWLAAWRLTFATELQSAASMEDVEETLRARPDIMSVEPRPKLLKSHPPQRELVVTIIDGDGSARAVVLAIAEPDGRSVRVTDLRWRDETGRE